MYSGPLARTNIYPAPPHFLNLVTLVQIQSNSPAGRMQLNDVDLGHELGDFRDFRLLINRTASGLA